MQLPARYPYNAKVSTGLIGVVFFGVCLAVFIRRLLTHEGGDRVFGIEIGPAAAAGFAACLAVVAALLVLMGVAAVARGLFNPKELVLREDALELPHGFLQTKTAVIPYADILAIQPREVAGQHSLELHLSANRKVAIAAVLLSQEAFLEIKSFLLARTTSPKQPTPWQ